MDAPLCPVPPRAPYTVIGIGGPGATQFAAFDLRTGNTGVPRHDYHEALMDTYSLAIRNLMHG